MRLVLASTSPRRRDLLARIGVIPDRIAAPDVEETPLKGELPRAYVTRIAQAKALAVAREVGEIVLAVGDGMGVGKSAVTMRLERFRARVRRELCEKLQRTA